jgi:hypothetical protein
MHRLLSIGLLAACSAEPGNTGDDGTEDTLPTRTEYICGWDVNDPGDLVATGNEVGDVVADYATTDQCGEPYRLWDGAGKWTYVMAPPFW